jgi:hypothetical protein
MSTYVRQRWALQRAGVLSALLAAVLLAPSAARASCGEYVVLGPGMAHVGPASRVGESVPPGPQAPAGLPMKHGPCHGSGCSRGPLLPESLTPVPPAPCGGERWGCVSELLTAAETPVAGSTPEDGSTRAVRRGAAVYHPPR